MDTLEEENTEQQKAWINSPTITDMNQAVQAAQTEYLTHVQNVKKWLGDLNVVPIPIAKGSRPRSTVVPKLIRKHAEWRYSSLSEPFHTADTLFKVSPVTGKDTNLAQQDSAILAYQFRNNIPRVKFIDDMVRTAVDEGTVVYHVGWEVKTKLVNIPVVIDGQYIGDSPDTVIEYSRPTVDILDFDQVLIDPSCRGNIEKATYVIVKKQTTIQELRSIGGYDNLDALTVGDLTIIGSDKVFASAYQDKERNPIEVLEYWGFWDTEKTGTLEPIIVTFCQNKILKMIESPYPFKTLPFVVTHYLPVRKDSYGQPDGFLLSDSQHISGALTRGIIDLLGKSANGQVGYKQNALDQANLLRFQRGEDYTFRGDSNPNEIMVQHTYPEIPASAINMLSMQQNEAESLTGVSVMGQGINSNSLGTGSATAAKGAMTSASKRESGMLRRLASGLEEVAKKIVAMNHKFLEPEFVMMITDKPFVNPEHQSEVDIVIAIRTAEADEASAQDLAFLLQTIGNTLDPSFTQMIVSKIARLKGLPDLADEIQAFTPQPDPVAEEMKQIQLALAQAQMANEQLKSELLQAQIATEQEKGRKIGSEADMVNLEFVEEETGTNHERQLEVMSKQAESNMYHTSLKAELDARNAKNKRTK